MKKSLAKILADKKLVVNKLNKKIQNLEVTALVENDKIGNNTKEEVVKNITADKKAIRDLIAERDKLSRALLKANAETRVSIGKEIYTIVEAIARKSTIETDKVILRKMISSLERVKMLKAQKEEQLENRIDSIINNGESANAQVVIDSMRNLNKFEVLNEAELEAEIKELSESIETFESDIDFALSEVNAITLVEV